MALSFSQINYTDSNFGANDGRIINIALAGGTGTVTVTIKNSLNVVIYLGNAPVPDQLNLPPEIYTLSAVDQIGEKTEEIDITIAEKPETILESNITDACNCDNCDCIVSVTSYIHNSNCFRYNLYDGAILVDTFDGCIGDEAHQFTNLCTGDYRVEAIELDTVLYIYGSEPGCPAGPVVVDESIIVTDWERFVLLHYQYSVVFGFPGGQVFNGGTPVITQNQGGYSGLQNDGTIDYNNIQAYFYIGATGVPATAPPLFRFKGAFGGANAPTRDGENTTPTGYPGVPIKNDFYYNTNTNKFVTYINVLDTPSVTGWVTFAPTSESINPVGPPVNGVAIPNATDLLSTSAQWNLQALNTGQYTTDGGNNVVLASTLGTDMIVATGNSLLSNGFFSKCSIKNYVHEVTIGSQGNDNDDITIILARIHDVNGDYGPAGLVHTLSLDIMSRNWVFSPYNPLDSLNGANMSINYNRGLYHSNHIGTFTSGDFPPDLPGFGGTSAEVNWESRLIYRTGVNQPIPGGAGQPNWNSLGNIKIRIERSGASGELFSIKMTETMGNGIGTVQPGNPNPFNPAYDIDFSLIDPGTWTDAASYVVNNTGTASGLPAHEALEKFLGPVSYGYATYSQALTQFFSINILGEQDSTSIGQLDGEFDPKENDLTTPCELCYEATNCENSEDTMLITLPANQPALDVSVTYVFNEFPDQCWTIRDSTGCGGVPANTISLNTGFIDAIDTLGVEDDQDFNWKLITESNDVPIVPRPAIISNQTWFGGYGTIFNTLWITQTTGPGVHPSLGGFSEYELEFTLPVGFVPSLVLDILTDNNAVITLNGFVIGDNTNPTIYPQPWAVPSQFTTTNPAHFIAVGTNKLKIRIKDSDQANKSNGFALSGSITSLGIPQVSTEVTINEIFADCDTCLGGCYILVDCKGEVDAFYTNTELSGDLSAYVGQIVTIVTCPDVCWQLEEIDCPLEVTEAIEIISSYPDCETCDPAEVPVPFVNSNRTVKPGYDTKGCSAAYVEKISCDFSEAMFQKAASKRYGIDFCCSFDVDELSIKKQLMEFKMIFDPEACVSPINPCCSEVSFTNTGITSIDVVFNTCDVVTTTLIVGAGETSESMCVITESIQLQNDLVVNSIEDTCT